MPAFDFRESPSLSGAIMEVFRKRAGVMRSIHPTHSISALGPQAAFLTEGHQRSQKPFGPDTPLARLLDVDGKIVCLGVTIAYVTWYHAFEDLHPEFPLRVYLPETFEAEVVDADGVVTTVTTYCHDPSFSNVRIEKVPDVLRKIEDGQRSHGTLRSGTAAAGSAHILPTRVLNRSLEALLREGITIYDLPVGA